MLFRQVVPFLFLLAPAGGPPSLPKGEDAPFWTGTPDAETFGRGIDGRLDRARRNLDRLLQVRGTRTVSNTLVPYDQIQRDLEGTSNESLLIQEVHPDSAMRSTAEGASQRTSALATEISLDRRVYDAVSRMDLIGADRATRFYVARILRDFRLAGVDKDSVTRARIRELREELVKVGQEFSRNIQSDVRTVRVNSVSELAGLPADFIASHKPGPDGTIAVTTEYPDAYPVFSYARSGELRRRLRVAFDNRGYPRNMAVLDRMLALRSELARVLGFPSWADYITADKMVGSAANASTFIDRILQASERAAGLEYRALLRRKQQDDSSATVVNRWDQFYLENEIRRSDYQFDAQSVRPYFSFEAVKRGVLEVSGRLFGVSFRQMKNPPVWDPSVEGWEVLDHGRLLGRFYLDMHPRPDRYKHAAEFPIRNGVAGQRLPEAALVCNLPGGTPGDPGLMEHEDVVTFFHEFGHLMHTMLGGRQEWVGLAPSRVEWDFIEAPSQMLEEWTSDPAVLATFARHYQTGEPIPASLVRQMNRAENFGRALQVRQQMAYARLSLSYYDRPPSAVNTDSIAQAVTRAYTPFPPVPDSHYQTAFTHLDGYSAIYYTYMWSKVIAKDLFSRFDRSNLLDAGRARRYRDAVLAPGGSEPAATLVEQFLGRPFGFGAWQKWLETGD